jgi:hypothetical protein
MTPLHRHRTPTPGDLVDLARQLTADAGASLATLRHRDRRLGQALGARTGQPIAQLLAWLDGMRGESQDAAIGARVDAAHRLGMALLAVIGLIAGWGAAAVVFFYDGQHPVNVIHVLAVFVLLQLLLSLLFVLVNLAGGAMRLVPGLTPLLDSMRSLGPGGLQYLLRRSLPPTARDTLDRLLGRGQGHLARHGAVDRWLVTHSTQVFALAFNVGALAGAAYLVVFSDLAFAWSTTLQLSAGDLGRWTDALSAPWAALWADARPSPELIEATRYFRLGEGTFPESPSLVGLGGWWPFLIMAMAVYGVVPRLVTLLVARWRLRSALRRAVRHYPGVDDLLVRLNDELVETHADEPDRDTPHQTGAVELDEPTSVAGQPAVVVDWSGAAADREAVGAWLGRAVELTVAQWLDAGGAHALADDRATIAAVDEAPGLVVVAVKAWEPPMAELSDFLRDLRAAVGAGRLVHVLPLGVDGGGAPQAAEPRHHDLWRRMLASIGDTGLRLLQPGGEPS